MYGMYKAHWMYGDAMDGRTVLTLLLSLMQNHDHTLHYHTSATNRRNDRLAPQVSLRFPSQTESFFPFQTTPSIRSARRSLPAVTITNRETIRRRKARGLASVVVAIKGVWAGTSSLGVNEGAESLNVE